ncbi:MAG: polymerase III subunit beta, DNA polymerase III subunit beta protein [candidate division WS6 bacterium GW2011_GWC1_33_20]|uniref:Beta sliding clamp n=2 Tax=Candidatus Dojkabacteria TaxID=74243 RepID=A0A0G0AVF0_9BACT|nr:MAG: polymerase III subunit beta, DNA polymerase III subunit beta protein [candidate division WS6 bacterium GW2011_GWE2_33_157]KKP44265.1 MAG: polymerase III subunit beta, DNA polymerase III subunit beta protein [candidate division WS6 bacterium GW2011_GWC1_33_20]KKP45870.1 MAG: polymerase III subunit beta, DNA polymerase III subunit beta protein [candidate division WS6 bacterium GW2011_GWF1_33_233]KKP55133.1 MAG: polymerase III subunit beta, DNA polymerase III subunit beta protein [candidate
MQFSCNQDTLRKYLNIISRVVSSKPGLPILNNVQFESSKGKLMMTATDLEIGINTWIGADVRSEGKITVPAKQLTEFVNSIPSETIDVSLDNQSFNITSTNNSASFNTMSAEDFPAVATVTDKTPLFKLSKEDLVKAVERVAFASATDDIKPVLTGVLLEVAGESISFVGTDGLRLSRQILKIDSNAESDVNVLIPVKALLELSHIVSEIGEDDDIEVYLIEDRNQILFRYSGVDLVSRLIDGQFPEYRQIIPTGYKTLCKISKSEFINSLKVTNTIAKSVLGNKLILDIDSSDNKITLSATQTDLGSNKSVFDAKVDGDSIKIAFSSRLLTDILNHIDSEDIVFECSETIKPGVFKITEDPDFVHLVMPMML